MEHALECIASENDQVGTANPVGEGASERLQMAVEHGGGPSKVARSTGIPLSSLNHYLKGREMRPSALVAVSDATGVSLEWLAAGRGEMVHAPEGIIMTPHHGAVDRSALASNLSLSRYVPIPRYNIQASAGNGSLAGNAQIVEYMAFDEQFIRIKLRRDPKYLLLVEARGDSMEPVIRDGDVLTVDITPDQTVSNGGLYVLRVGDDLLVKRVEKRLSSLVLHSENTRYQPEIVALTDVDQLLVVGRVLLVTTPPR